MSGVVRRMWVPISLVAATLCVALPSWAQSAAEARLVGNGFSRPITVTSPGGDPRLFVVERAGRIRIVKDGSTLPVAFLDISSLVDDSGEGGLLDVAFPRDYRTSGLFYVHYTDLAGDTRVVRYAVSANPDVANPASARGILFINQPTGRGNHKAGSLLFGPDGFLWFPTGDGGGGGDPDELAQNRQSLLGKVLRIDVGPVFAPGSIPVSGAFYRIPASNPFAGSSSTRREIWALGLRNPYRASFDRQTGNFWLSDVGQGEREEVNFVPAGAAGGLNFGWDVMEGTTCYLADPAPAPPCNSPSLTLPLLEYDHSDGDCAIIGGHVFRNGMNALTGHYFFGDFCSGRVLSLNPATGLVTDRTAQLGPAAGVPFSLVGFGEDGLGRVYVVHESGAVYQIQPASPACSDGIDNDADGRIDFPSDPDCVSASSNSEFPGCGIGPELAVLLPILYALRRRQRAVAAA